MNTISIITIADEEICVLYSHSHTHIDFSLSMS